MTDIQAMVAEFHEAMGHPNKLAGGGVPNAEHERKELRLDLIQEEFEELTDAAGSYYPDKKELSDTGEYDPADTVEYADALGDMSYVIFGAALEAGIDLNAVITEIHRSNRTKVGGPVRADGKKLKPDTFEEPQIAKVLGL